MDATEWDSVRVHAQGIADQGELALFGRVDCECIVADDPVEAALVPAQPGPEQDFGIRKLRGGELIDLHRPDELVTIVQPYVGDQA